MGFIYEVCWLVIIFTLVQFVMIDHLWVIRRDHKKLIESLPKLLLFLLPIADFSGMYDWDKD